jgi:hypothetical protein
MDWFSPFFESKDQILHNFEAFIERLRGHFEDPQRRENSAACVNALRQGRQAVSAYACTFQLLLSDAGWDDVAA